MLQIVPSPSPITLTHTQPSNVTMSWVYRTRYPEYFPRSKHGNTFYNIIIVSQVATTWEGASRYVTVFLRFFTCWTFFWNSTSSLGFKASKLLVGFAVVFFPSVILISNCLRCHKFAQYSVGRMCSSWCTPENFCARCFWPLTHVQQKKCVMKTKLYRVRPRLLWSILLLFFFT